MQKREADFQAKFNRWCKYNIHETTCFQLKYCRGNALQFSAVNKHQIQSLLNAKHRKILWKISDFSYESKPFDSFLISKAPSYIVIQYASENRANKTFFMIDIDRFVKEMKGSDRKSLTEERAGQIGKKCQLGIID